MYLSFHRSQHALLALGFFVVMVLIVFSTLLSVVLLLLPGIYSDVGIYFVDISSKGERGTIL